MSLTIAIMCSDGWMPDITNLRCIQRNKTFTSQWRLKKRNNEREYRIYFKCRFFRSYRLRIIKGTSFLSENTYRDLSDMDTVTAKFHIWRLEFNDFCTVTNLKQQSPEYQLAIFR